MRVGGERSFGMMATVAFGLVACLLYGVGAGLRGDMGILLQPLTVQCGIAYEDASLCIAVMQLVFGVSQPVFGVVASRRSNRFVLLMGVLLVAVSLAGMAFSRSFVALLVSLGALFGCGAGALAFGLVLSSAIRFVGSQRAMTVSGMLNAAAGLGAFVLSPILRALSGSVGSSGALLAMLIPVALLVPAAVLVTSRDLGRGAHVVPACRQDGGAVIAPRSPLPFREAFCNRTFLLLVAGFSTCGFHMVIIESHLFNQFVFEGVDVKLAAWAFSLYGVATILGALLSGWLSSRASKGFLLAFYYGFRAVWVFTFVFVAPKTFFCAAVFAVGLGFTGDATVSPTSGLVSREFCVDHVATLVGVLFLCHQVGAFLSAWLGGVLFEATSGYGAIWAIDIVACTFAALASARIKGR